MQALRTVFVGFVLAAAVNLAGCRGLEQPYPPGKPPAVADLMAATKPGLRSIQVPRAKVRQGSAPAANLMLVAQAPARFAGTIQVSGNELVTLAVNEHEYGLRWLAGREGESLAPGYYSGPPSRCAVATLLGVDLEPEAFVEMVLGGAPLIAEPHEILDRRWDRKQGRELLTIANERYRQELGFEWIGGHWQFAAATSWATSGGEPVWLWTISHEQLHEVGGEVLPAKTQIRRPKPSGRGELVVTITYQKQLPNPSIGGELSPDAPLDDEQPPNAGDTWEDDWDDEGWEDDDEAVPAQPKPEARPPEIPPQFRGNPTGLIPRGDLCVGRR